MATQIQDAPRSGKPRFQPFHVNVKVKISALWTALLFVFAYVDIFSLYRPDFRADIEAGQIAGFTINETFLLGTTLYVAIPSLMVFGTLVFRPRLNRYVNIALSGIYALTIVAGAVGEWNYYMVGSAVEVALLMAIAFYAWSWPRLATPGSSIEEPLDVVGRGQATLQESVGVATGPAPGTVGPSRSG